MPDFIRHIQDRLGYAPNPDQLAAGRIARFSTTGRQDDRAGWAKMFPDSEGGVFGDWRQGIQETWQAREPATPDERERFRRKVAQAKAEAEAQRQSEHAEAVVESKRRWDAARPACPGHAYLLAKSVKPCGIRQEGNNLLVPVRDIDGALYGLQTIQPDGFKKFELGTWTRGNLFILGEIKDRLLIAEGYATAATLHEATGYPVVVAFNAGNLKPVAEVMKTRHPAATITICADDDHKTEGNPGLTKARAAARAVDCVLAVPVFPDTRGDKDTDFNDLARLSGLEAVRACFESVKPVETDAQQDNSLDATIKRLVELTPLEYETVRKEEAKTLGVRPSVLDSAVKEARKGSESSDLPFNEVDPWPSPIDPAGLLTDIATTVRRFIVCDKEIAQAVALWATMTWLVDVVRVAPIAFITAPEKQCGKTMLLTLIGEMSARAITASNISSSALFRSIDQWNPTLFIDEADSFFTDNEELRGILNSGHTRDSAYVIRTVGEDFKPTKFSTWGAKAIAGIGHIADTLMDRSIVLELRRKLPHEKADKRRNAEPGLFENQRSKLARFAEDYREQVKQARPQLPYALNDRAADNWEPLFQIASVAGPEWLDNATEAALKLSGDNAAPKSIGVELLSDIMEVFDEKQVDRISTGDLITALCADDERPWATYNRGKQITPRQVSSRLKGYGITSRTIRIGLGTPKGFSREQFQEAVDRYCGDQKNISDTSPENIRHTPQVNNGEASRVADRKALSATIRHTQQAPSQSTGDLWPCEPSERGEMLRIAGNVAECCGNEKISATREPLSVKDCGVVANKTPPTGKNIFSEEIDLREVTL